MSNSILAGLHADDAALRADNADLRGAIRNLTKSFGALLTRVERVEKASAAALRKAAPAVAPEKLEAESVAAKLAEITRRGADETSLASSLGERDAIAARTKARTTEALKGSIANALARPSRI